MIVRDHEDRGALLCSWATRANSSMTVRPRALSSAAVGSSARSTTVDSRGRGRWRRAVARPRSASPDRHRRDGRRRSGRLVINIAELPIKCPVAPLELAFLADAYFTQRGIRDKVELVYATPLEGAFTKPVASRLLGGMLAARGIHVIGDFAASEVDGTRRRLKAYDGRELDYDLLVSIPTHAGSEIIERSGLGDASGWVPTHRSTLAVPTSPNTWAIGDATDLPSSKAGAVAHFQSDVLVENVLAVIDGRAPMAAFDGHANCFIETGHGKAMLIDFNYDTEPLPGKFPLPGVGPFSLLEETAVNHWGKLAFKWIYWNVLVRGKELPLDHRMLMAGKHAA